jgi:hypothetical protein
LFRADYQRALSILHRVQTHRIVLAGRKAVTGISTLAAEQTALLASLGIKKLTSSDRYANL